VKHFDDILFKEDNGIATITLNRPEKLNAFRQQTLDEMSSCFEEVSADSSIGVAVLASSGPRAFCVGGDISEMKDLNQKSGKVFIDSLLRFANGIRNLGKPIIAKVRGYCLGGGHEMHLMCDLTYADTTAVFGQTGPKVGSVPLWGATQILPRLVGEKKAREIIYLCQQYSAQEAYQIGLVNEVLDPKQLDDHVHHVCQEILKKSPQSLRLSREAMNRQIPWEEWTSSLEQLLTCYGSKELQEGMNAFLEKREAAFRG
jgi:dihydroxynaphthoic acid synthetase